MIKTLKDLREAEEFTIKQSACMLRMPASTLSAYERGTKYPNAEDLQKLANHYRMDLEEMKDLINNQNNDKPTTFTITAIKMTDNTVVYTHTTSMELYKSRENDKEYLLVYMCDKTGRYDLNVRVIRWLDVKCIYPTNAMNEYDINPSSSASKLSSQTVDAKQDERIVVNATIDTSALDDDGPSYVKRMVDELYELNKKIDKIRLMDKDILDETEANLLANQLKLMMKYSGILSQRIEYAKNKN